MHVSNSFKRNVITLASGNSLAQIIPVLIAPILTRIYSVEDFAAFALFISVCSVLGVFSNLKYASSIVIAESSHEASVIISLCIRFILTLSVLVAAILFFDVLGAKTILSDKVTDYWLLIPLFIASVAFHETLTFFYTRNKLFKHLSFMTIFKSIITVLCNLLLYPFFGDNLIVSQFIGFGIIAIYSGLTFYKNDAFKHDLSDVKSVAHKYKDFPINKLPQNLLDIINTNGVIFIIVYFFGDSELGLYALLFRVMLLPVKLIGTAIGQVIFSELSDLTQYSYQKIKKTIIFVVVLTLLPYSIVFFYGGEIFAYVFGDDWFQAGVYAATLTPYFLLYLPASALSYVPTAFRRLRLGFYIALCGNSISLILYVIAGLYYDLATAFEFISIAMTIYYLVVILYYFKMIKNNSTSATLETKSIL